jgi:YHS domain-containing protein
VSSSARLLDPVCDMVVAIESARDTGLALEMPDREYAFCSHGCLITFAKSPELYQAKVDRWLVETAREHNGGARRGATLVIDDGMRDWYKSCRCCLSEAHPEVVEILDREKAEAAHK